MSSANFYIQLEESDSIIPLDDSVSEEPLIKFTESVNLSDEVEVVPRAKNEVSVPVDTNHEIAAPEEQASTSASTTYSRSSSLSYHVQKRRRQGLYRSASTSMTDSDIKSLPDLTILNHPENVERGSLLEEIFDEITYRHTIIASNSNSDSDSDNEINCAEPNNASIVSSVELAGVKGCNTRTSNKNNITEITNCDNLLATDEKPEAELVLGSPQNESEAGILPASDIFNDGLSKYDDERPITLESSPSGLIAPSRIVWLGECGTAYYGTVKWIGKIKSDLYGGVEFDRKIGNSSGLIAYGTTKSLSFRAFHCELGYGKFIRLRELLLTTAYDERATENYCTDHCQASLESLQNSSPKTDLFNYMI